jgi:cell division protein FtsI/penicillin-binding protein 2
MLKVLTISVFLIISATLWGQIDSKRENLRVNDSVKLDPLYFTLGTLWDYTGRVTYVNKKSQVDRYYSFEKPIIDYLFNLIKEELNIDISNIPGNEKNVARYETFSPELSEKINSFFKENHLIIDSLKNIPKLNYSYLAGRYYRYGEKINDSIYAIQIANSSDHSVCDSLLRRVGCTKIHFRYLKNIPAQFIYYFIPTNELERYFDYISKEKEELENSYNAELGQRFKFSDTTLKKVEEIEEKKYQEIIGLFKQ